MKHNGNTYTFPYSQTQSIMETLSYFVFKLLTLVPQMVKSLPAIQETQVWSLSRKIPWRRGWQPTPIFLPGKSHGLILVFLVAQMVMNLPAIWETQVGSLGREDPLEKEMATRSSILAWRILCTEEPGGLQSLGSQKVRHYWATNAVLVNFKRKTARSIFLSN